MLWSNWSLRERERESSYVHSQTFAIWDSIFFCIVMTLAHWLCLSHSHTVYWSCSHLCLIDQGDPSAVCLYVHCAISAKFGVVVCKASMLDWMGGPSAVHIYVHCAISAKFGVVVCKASMLDWRGGPCAVGIYVHCAISATFGVAVCKASMLEWQEHSICCWDICVLCYICQVWCSGIQGIYVWLQGGLICHGHICIVLFI